MEAPSVHAEGYNDIIDYDVVSAAGEWKSGDPFDLTGIDGDLYGRGVIDNKGGTGRLGRFTLHASLISSSDRPDPRSCVWSCRPS